MPIPSFCSCSERNERIILNECTNKTLHMIFCMWNFASGINFCGRNVSGKPFFADRRKTTQNFVPHSKCQMANTRNFEGISTLNYSYCQHHLLTKLWFQQYHPFLGSLMNNLPNSISFWKHHTSNSKSKSYEIACLKFTPWLWDFFHSIVHG